MIGSVVGPCSPISVRTRSAIDSRADPDAYQNDEGSTPVEQPKRDAGCRTRRPREFVAVDRDQSLTKIGLRIRDRDLPINRSFRRSGRAAAGGE